MIDRHDYVQKLKARLDEWDREVDALETRLGDMKGEAGQRARLALGELKLTRRQLIERVDELLGATDDAWQRIRLSFESAWDNLKSGLSAARTELISKQNSTDR